MLLEILSDYQVSIPELGTIEAKQIPLVFLTSNNTRELSEALKRRCLYLHVDYPSWNASGRSCSPRCAGHHENLADQVARIVRSIRQLDLKKAPSVSETLDWARTLMLLNIETIDEQTAKETLNILLKYQTDIAKAAELDGDESRRCRRLTVDDRSEGHRRHARAPERLRRRAAQRGAAGVASPRTSTRWRRSSTSRSRTARRSSTRSAATLIKNHAHWRSFETVFEVYFSLRGPEYKISDDGDGDPDRSTRLWREMQEQMRRRGQGPGRLRLLTPEEIARC